jgi:hypothetical protein
MMFFQVDVKKALATQCRLLANLKELCPDLKAKADYQEYIKEIPTFWIDKLYHNESMEPGWAAIPALSLQLVENVLQRCQTVIHTRLRNNREFFLVLSRSYTSWSYNPCALPCG